MSNNGKNLAIISLIINAVLVIAVIILFVNMSKGGKTEANNGASDSLNLTNMNEMGSSAKIVYYQSDSLNTRSKFIMQLQKEIADAQINAEARLKSKQDELMRWDQKWQAKMPLLSSEEEQYMREGQKKQEELMMLQQQLEQELYETQNKLTLTGVTRIQSYCRDIALEEGYDYVISYQLGGQFLFCNPKMDITDQLIEKMNADFDSTATIVETPAATAE